MKRQMAREMFAGRNRCRKLHRGLRPVSLDMDPVLVLAHLHQIVGSLGRIQNTAFDQPAFSSRSAISGGIAAWPLRTRHKV